MEDDKKNFARALQAAREEAKLSQAELGERIGVSQQSVGKWEAGSAMPSAGNLRLLKEILGDFWHLSRAATHYLEMQPDITRRLAMLREPRMSYGAGSGAEAQIINGLPESLKGNIRRANTATGRYDYASEGLVVEMSRLIWPAVISLEGKLWRLLTMKVQNNDQRMYCMIITVPEELRKQIDVQRTLARLTTDAERVDLQVFLAEDAHDIVDIICQLEGVEPPRLPGEIAPPNASGTDPDADHAR